MPKQKNPRARRSLADRFHAKIQPAAADDLSPNGWADCLLWSGSQSPKGYGRINSGGRGRPLIASRVAYELAHGPIPGNLEVDHLCRRPSCVNVAHLELVTTAVNAQRSARSRLTWDAVDEIRALRAAGWTLQRLADRHGVTNQTIDAVVKGRVWREGTR